MARITYIGSRTPMTEQDWLDLGWTQEEARTLAMRPRTQTRVLKVVEESGSGGIRTGPLDHVVRHSPTGFEWGYAGDGDD